MTGVSSRPATHRHSGPDEKQALLTFHQELTETCVDLMSRYSFANCGVTPRRDKMTAFLLSQGQSSSWILGIRRRTRRWRDRQEEGTPRVRGASEGLPEPDAEVRPLVKNDSHVSVARAGSGSRRGSLVTAGEVPGSVSACGCWCQVTIIVTISWRIILMSGLV